MNAVSLLEAWDLWLSGQTVTGYLLWGIPIFWWGRAGKIITLLSAASIIADILGPEKIRAFGKSLGGRFGLRQARSIIATGIKWYGVMWRYLLAPRGSKQEKAALDESYQYSADTINYVLTFVIVIAVTFLLRENFAKEWLFIGAVLAYVIGIVTYGPFLTICAILLSMIFLAAIDIVLIQPAAWILERPSLDKLVKLTSFTLLMIGFHFDLLAS